MGSSRSTQESHGPIGYQELRADHVALEVKLPTEAICEQRENITARAMEDGITAREMDGGMLARTTVWTSIVIPTVTDDDAPIKERNQRTAPPSGTATPRATRPWRAVDRSAG